MLKEPANLNKRNYLYNSIHIYVKFIREYEKEENDLFQIPFG